MPTRLVIPTDDQNGTELAEHFGRAAYFAVIDIDDNGNTTTMNVHPNTSEHSGGRGHAHDNILIHNPRAVIVQGMGPRGIMSFQSQHIAVLQANSKSVQELVAAYTQNKLQELTEGCADAHHK